MIRELNEIITPYWFGVPYYSLFAFLFICANRVITARRQQDPWRAWIWGMIGAIDYLLMGVMALLYGILSVDVFLIIMGVVGLIVASHYLRKLWKRRPPRDRGKVGAGAKATA